VPPVKEWWRVLTRPAAANLVDGSDLVVGKNAKVRWTLIFRRIRFSAGTNP
jgi:hypothetical protein